MNKIVQLKGREAPKSRRAMMDTMLFARDDILAWKLPGFQRPLRVNAKVMEVAEELKANGGIIPGVLTLGKLGTDKTFYVVDGQHRIEAFKISDLKECIADVRICNFESMADMAEEFVELNGRLVTMRPDDILRGLEESLPQLRRIRASCDFVTYGQIKRNDDGSAIIGMSQLLRCWHMGNAEVPARHSPSATALAQALEAADADRLIVFMQTCRAAWGTDVENYRLWSSLNLTICAWMWRRLVSQKDRTAAKKAVIMTPEDFKKCLMSVSANGEYLDWLVGRMMGERDRAPCYGRLKAIFTKRLTEMGHSKVMLPYPSWTSR